MPYRQIAMLICFGGAVSLVVLSAFQTTKSTAARNPTTSPSPTPTALTQPEAKLMRVIAVPGNAIGWNLRKSPRGEVVGFVPFNAPIYSTETTQPDKAGMPYTLVYCPGTACTGQAWINSNALEEVK